MTGARRDAGAGADRPALSGLILLSALFAVGLSACEQEDGTQHAEQAESQVETETPVDGANGEQPADPALCFAGTTPAEHYQTALDLRREAGRLAGEEDNAGAAAALEQALEHQPGHASILANLAILSAMEGDGEAARRWLEEIHAAGIALPAAAIAGAMPEDIAEANADLLSRIEANGAPAGNAVPMFSIDQPDILIESIAVLDGRFFVSGIVQPGLYRVGEDATLTNLLADEMTASVFRLHPDPQTGLVWAATATVEQTPPDRRGIESALLAVDPATGDVVHRITLPGAEAQITDFVIGEDAIWFTDQAAGAIYRLVPGEEPSVLIPPGGFGSLQGLALAGGALYAADYAAGLYRIDTASCAAARVDPGGAALLGIDGLSGDGAGGLIAIRNGARPHGVLHLGLSADGGAVASVTPLAVGFEDFNDPTHGVVEDGAFRFIANSQWPDFPADGSAPAQPRQPVLIMSTPLP